MKLKSIFCILGVVFVCSAFLMANTEKKENKDNHFMSAALEKLVDQTIDKRQVEKNKEEKYQSCIKVTKKEDKTRQETKVELISVKEKYINLGTFKATAYCSCEKCCGKWATTRPKNENGDPIVYTASGTIAKQGRTIAADPEVLPLGTELLINGERYIVEDTGSGIYGNRIDVYFENHEEALIFGIKNIEIVKINV